MDVTIPVWAIPVALTIGIWVIAIVWPKSEQTGDYNFSQAFDATLGALLAVIATLVVWLVFFAILWMKS